MPQTNKKDFQTSGYAADIFVISQPGAKFANHGNLTTSGDFASPIRATADGVTITNRGNLRTSGDGSYGIVAGDLLGSHYDHVTIVNYGSITTSGDFLDDGINFAFGADGIEQNGNNGTVINYGSITTLGPDSAGVGHIGANSQITNYGQINATGIGIVSDTIDGSETGNIITNYGQIHTTGDGSHGIWLFSESNVVRNFGTIQADGFNGFGIAMEAGGNHADNYGTILVTGEIARGVLLLGENTSFDNYGLVRATGEGSIGVRFSSENLPGTDGGTFTNYGRVDGAARSVSGVDSNDHVINHGMLVGDVSLGAGNDSYVAGHGGSLAGELILGAGNDLVVCQRGCGGLAIADFLTGAGSDDALDLSAFGYHSLDELLAHALQQGSDTLLNLSGHDQVLLEGVSLASLAADDFIFGASHGLGAAMQSGFEALVMHIDSAPAA
jgi:hypothetical protein